MRDKLLYPTFFFIISSHGATNEIISDASLFLSVVYSDGHRECCRGKNCNCMKDVQKIR